MSEAAEGTLVRESDSIQNRENLPQGVEGVKMALQAATLFMHVDQSSKAFTFNERDFRELEGQGYQGEDHSDRMLRMRSIVGVARALDAGQSFITFKEGIGVFEETSFLKEGSKDTKDQANRIEIAKLLRIVVPSLVLKVGDSTIGFDGGRYANDVAKVKNSIPQEIPEILGPRRK
jgi:hypothetical protein